MSQRFHLHLLSDSTGETLENIAKAALAQFDGAENVVKHFWPMVRSESHLDRILLDVATNPGLVLFTLVNRDTRRKLETRCRAMGLPAVAALDALLRKPLLSTPDFDLGGEWRCVRSCG